MPKPISWRKMLRRFRKLGWTGPFPGGKHPMLRKGQHTVTIPNPNRSEIDWSLMKRILKEADIEASEWERLD